MSLSVVLTANSVFQVQFGDFLKFIRYLLFYMFLLKKSDSIRTTMTLRTTNRDSDPCVLLKWLSEHHIIIVGCP